MIQVTKIPAIDLEGHKLPPAYSPDEVYVAHWMA
jgi:hypothetical protein